MKKMIIALATMLLTAATAHAMSYEQARNEALFLTDKMAYELNLTDEQYEAAYEINLDYLMGVTSYDDVYGTYWERRNLDMSYVLLDWQWRTFCAASYFYRPLYWRDGFWHFGIYARYPHRDYFYFGRPVFYASYRGGHAWHIIGGKGYYHGRRDHYQPVGRSHFGMLDRWNRGDFHHNRPSHYSHGNSGHFGGVRNSSTRTTANHDRGSFGGSRNSGSHSSFGSSRSGGSFESSRNSDSHNHNHSSFGNSGSHSSFGSSHSGGSFGSSHSGGSFGGSRNSGSHSSFGSSRSGGSFSSGSTHSSGGSSRGGNSSRGSGSGHFGRGR